MDGALLAFNFNLGLVAFFSPCGLPMLPAYLSYYLTRDAEDRARGPAANLLRGLGGGALAAAGAFATLAAIGLAALAVGAPLKERLVGLELVGGLVLVALGVLVLLGRGPSVALALRPSTKRGALGLLSFGALYAMVASSCVAPVFIGMVVVATRAATPAEGALDVAAYAAGFATLLVAVTVLVALAQHRVVAALKSATRHAERIGGVALVAAGLYLVLYWAQVAFA